MKKGFLKKLFSVLSSSFLGSDSRKADFNKENYVTKRIKLNTIPGEKPDAYYRQFRTKVVGVTFNNLDGSSRQEAIRKLKRGQRLQLAWNPSDPYDSNAILVFGRGNMCETTITSCIGHLKADLAKDVVKWATSDDLNGVYAEVVKVIGGKSDQESLGVIIEITVY